MHESDSDPDDPVSSDMLTIRAILALSSSDYVSSLEESESSHDAMRIFFFSLKNLFLGLSFLKIMSLLLDFLYPEDDLDFLYP